jgi:hypothetical protein
LARFVGAEALGALRRGASKHEEDHTMSVLLWTIALVCWSVAALLIVSMVSPDFFQPRSARHVDGEAKAE